MLMKPSAIILWASFHITSAQSGGGGIPSKLKLRILGDLDDKDLRVDVIAAKNCIDPALYSDPESIWCVYNPTRFTPDPDEPKSQYLQLNDIIFPKGSSMPTLVSVYDKADRTVFATVSC